MDSDPSSLVTSFDFEILISVITVLVLLLCSAFISGSEVALFSLSQKDIDDLKETDYSKGNLITNLLERPKKLLATILVANNFINIAIVIIFSSFSERIFGAVASEIIRFILEVVVVTFLILLFGEVLPKIYANRNNIAFSKLVATPISILEKLLSPLTIPMRNVTLYIEKNLAFKKLIFL